VEECGPCPIFASFTLAFALQLRKKHGKPSVRLRKISVIVQYTYYQNTHIPPLMWQYTGYKLKTSYNYWRDRTSPRHKLTIIKSQFKIHKIKCYYTCAIFEWMVHGDVSSINSPSKIKYWDVLVTTSLLAIGNVSKRKGLPHSAG
jgi:hypothetical protein